MITTAEWDRGEREKERGREREREIANTKYQFSKRNGDIFILQIERFILQIESGGKRARACVCVCVCVLCVRERDRRERETIKNVT